MRFATRLASGVVRNSSRGSSSHILHVHRTVGGLAPCGCRVLRTYCVRGGGCGRITRRLGMDITTIRGGVIGTLHVLHRRLNRGNGQG